MTQSLYDSAVNSKHKDLYIVEEGTHNDTWYRGGREYIGRLKQFIEKAMTIEREELKKSSQAEKEEKSDL